MPRPPVPTSELVDTVNVNFRMSERERRDLKLWCVEHDMTMTEALVSGAAVLRALVDRFRPDPADILLATIESADSYLIDPKRDIRVERLEEELWVVREGPHAAVNLDVRLEHADAADVERTAFRLPGALRIARAPAGHSE